MYHMNKISFTNDSEGEKPSYGRLWGEEAAPIFKYTKDEYKVC